MAAGLRQQGASKGAVGAFLIATPETGVDSVLVTYSLLDPAMALLRPLAAMVTAVAAGLGINTLGRGETRPEPAPLVELRPPSQEALRPWPLRLRQGMAYAFGNLLLDIGGWFLLGVALAGAITVALPPDLIEAHLGSGLLSMVVMLAVSLPLYVCATASTPIVAALAAKGLAPGAALVFLLAGPATNVAGLTVVARILGRRATVVYLAAIVVVSLALGLACNALYAAMDWSSLWEASVATHEGHGQVMQAAAVVLPLWIVFVWLRARWARVPRTGGCA